MAILVIGGSGFLGSEVVRLLQHQGFDVISLARGRYEGALSCDLTDAEQLFKVLNESELNAVINCAVTADFLTEDLSKLYPINVQLPANLAGWCKGNNKYYCHISGSLVQGITASYIDDSTPISIECEYALSKWLAEQLVLASGANASILRFGGIFGLQGPNHLGLNKALKEAKGGVVPNIYAKGVARRNYIHVRDAANVVVQSVQKEILGIRWCAGSEVLTIAEMMQQVSAVFCNDKEANYVAGSEASDQIILPSSDLDMGGCFLDALKRDSLLK